MRLDNYHLTCTFLITLLSCAYSAVGFFDPITIGVGIGGIVGQTYCRFTECCSNRYIAEDIFELSKTLKQYLYGQHIVIKHLLPALEAHLDRNIKPKKPLVISFHGTTGTGKTFVSDMIAQTLYTNGLKSKFVHKYLGRADFPFKSKAEQYKARINDEIREAIANCPRSLFIFDEVDKMPAGIFESLTSLVDYNGVIGGHDYTKAIFIFLSNTAEVHISNRLGKIMKDGTLREDTKIGDFKQTIKVAAYNLDGGMQKASLIEAHAIDHYIPFLPLEKSHVIKCIEAELKRWGKTPNEEAIDNIVENIVTYDPNHGLFAESGCKTVSPAVAFEVKTNMSLK